MANTHTNNDFCRLNRQKKKQTLPIYLSCVPNRAELLTSRRFDSSFILLFPMFDDLENNWLARTLGVYRGLKLYNKFVYSTISLIYFHTHRESVSGLRRLFCSLFTHWLGVSAYHMLSHQVYDYTYLKKEREEEKKKIKNINWLVNILSETLTHFQQRTIVFTPIHLLWAQDVAATLRRKLHDFSKIRILIDQSTWPRTVIQLHPNLSTSLNAQF